MGDWITLLQTLIIVLLSFPKRCRQRRKVPFAAIGFCSFLYYMSSVMCCRLLVVLLLKDFYSL